MSARLHIDWTACDGHGACAELLPELLEQDPWGYPLARAGAPTRVVPVPGELEQHAARAVEACPRMALRLTREGSLSAARPDARRP